MTLTAESRQVLNLQVDKNAFINEAILHYAQLTSDLPVSTRLALQTQEIKRMRVEKAENEAYILELEETLKAKPTPDVYNQGLINAHRRQLEDKNDVIRELKALSETDKLVMLEKEEIARYKRECKMVKLERDSFRDQLGAAAMRIMTLTP